LEKLDKNLLVPAQTGAGTRFHRTRIIKTKKRETEPSTGSKTGQKVRPEAARLGTARIKDILWGARRNLSRGRDKKKGKQQKDILLGRMGRREKPTEGKKTETGRRRGDRTPILVLEKS